MSPEEGDTVTPEEPEQLEVIRERSRRVGWWRDLEAVEQCSKDRRALLAEVDRLREALEQIASMKCPEHGECGAYDRGECQAGIARGALGRRSADELHMATVAHAVEGWCETALEPQEYYAGIQP